MKGASAPVTTLRTASGTKLCPVPRHRARVLCVCEAADVDLYWDPFDPDIDDDPHPTWRRLRDEAPVYRNEKHDFYALSRYADIDTAHRDPRTFSSARGTV